MSITSTGKLIDSCICNTSHLYVVFILKCYIRVRYWEIVSISISTINKSILWSVHEWSVL